MAIFIKRVYEPAIKSDGKRILVDRIWPRGLAKVEAKVDLWLKEVAPSTELRKWFGHDPEKWADFQKKYKAELKGNPVLAELKAVAKSGTVTLVFAAKDEDHNHAVSTPNQPLQRTVTSIIFYIERRAGLNGCHRSLTGAFGPTCKGQDRPTARQDQDSPGRKTGASRSHW